MKETAEATALVLSGGGARGAYEAGVLAGLGGVLGTDGVPVFEVFSGASVGAINAAYLAAHADRSDNGIPSSSGCGARSSSGSTCGRDRCAGPFEALIRERIPWDRLRANIRSGLVHALVVSALDILEEAASLGAHAEADCLSFVLFDGGIARTLIELGRRDVRSRAAEVEAFFDKGARL